MLTPQDLNDIRQIVTPIVTEQVGLSENRLRKDIVSSIASSEGKLHKEIVASEEKLRGAIVASEVKLRKEIVSKIRSEHQRTRTTINEVTGFFDRIVVGHDTKFKKLEHYLGISLS
ncbi:MAG TPA: hypothetical protein DCX25_03260 [Candidatus Pacebacteria bacterium]|nr:MAG: hypothetical protein UX00_C0001G0020 [Microgenomates group bacterium GW2011_GWB1_45_17]KKU24212.1 MAG: hypothetical protein UX36_C0002G0195 [Microgenomates group bacterium GW2011_GWC1_46_15]KKU24928.1 MAG: hypothetical protein UX35_C0001G0110 [Microgenomates group bacterium GW2011_GWA1_46_15]HAV15323.1 hypothetical protein [Candidatus Paceibacterota bacterium]HCR11405.1 hypothetical protein [Candidatus Paceibacterota bacterium]